MIATNSDGLFVGMFKKTFQENLLILVYAFEKGNHEVNKN